MKEKLPPANAFSQVLHDAQEEFSHVCGPECEQAAHEASGESPNDEHVCDDSCESDDSANPFITNIPDDPNDTLAPTIQVSVSTVARMTARMWYASVNELKRIGFDDMSAANVSLELTKALLAQIAQMFSSTPVLNSESVSDADKINQILEQIMNNAKFSAGN